MVISSQWSCVLNEAKKPPHDSEKIFRIGARGSQLSKWQATFVQKQLSRKHKDSHFENVYITTKGDTIIDKPLAEIGGKGVFTYEIEEALRAGSIDFAVHSQKDLPVEDATGISIGAVLKREDPSDVIISRKDYTLETLPKNATVGTSSPRRKGQLLFFRKDLNVIDIRGNMDTRFDKALDPNGPYDAIVVALAGVRRLRREDLISEVLGFDLMLPCPAQGAVAVQYATSKNNQAVLQSIHDEKTFLATLAERSYLHALGGGCALPVAALGDVYRNTLTLAGAVVSLDGSDKHFLQTQIDLPKGVNEAREAAINIGKKFAKIAIEDGVQSFLGFKR